MSHWKEVIKKISRILGILILYKVLTYAILPGININLLQPVQQKVDMFTNILFSGGLSKYSIMAAGLQPYLSATMIIQILTSGLGFESFRKLKQEQGGNLKLGEYTQYLTLGIAFLQGLYIADTLYYRSGPIVCINQLLFYIITSISIMFGSSIVLWMSNYISTFNVGSGSAFIICINVLGGEESTLYKIYELFCSGVISTYMLLIIAFMFMTIMLITILVEYSRSNIEVCYPSVEYMKDPITVNRNIPLKINNAGVMPLMMAACILEIPLILCAVLDKIGIYTHHIKYFLLAINNRGSIVHYIVYSILLCFFTYQYTNVVFNPQEVSQNLYSSGVVINGVRPLKVTEEYLEKRINALNFITCLQLILVCVLPSILSHYLNNRIGYEVIKLGSSPLIILISTIETIMQSSRRHIYNFADVVKKYII